MTETQYETINDIRKYKPFKGRIIDTISKLVAEGRRIISPKELMIQCLSGLKGDKKFLTKEDISTSLAVLSNPGVNEVKFCHNIPEIYKLNPKSKSKLEKINPHYEFSDTVLKITPEFYDSAEGLILPGSEVCKLSEHNGSYNLPKTRRKVWEYLAEGDTQLVTEYIHFVCSKLRLIQDRDFPNTPSYFKISYSFDDVMGLDMPKTKGSLNLLTIGGINSGLFSRSNAECCVPLDYSNSHIVGVLEEKGLEGKLNLK